jgi:tryptophan synthase beta subunit
MASTLIWAHHILFSLSGRGDKDADYLAKILGL